MVPPSPNHALPGALSMPQPLSPHELRSMLIGSKKVGAASQIRAGNGAGSTVCSPWLVDSHQRYGFDPSIWWVATTNVLHIPAPGCSSSSSLPSLTPESIMTSLIFSSSTVWSYFALALHLLDMKIARENFSYFSMAWSTVYETTSMD